MNGTRILVVDDDPAIRRVLTTSLTVRGYEVRAVETGEDAIRLAAEVPPDLIILDLMLPDLSGIEVCRRVRSMSAVPILVLSARGEERAKVQALNLGADDYVTKPFGMDELLARLRALLRRPPLTEQAKTGVLSIDDLTIDLDRREVRRDTVPLHLTAREFDILAYLMWHAGKVVTHRMLLADVWGPEYSGETHYLRVFVNRLRQKIEDEPGRPRHLLTEPGVGYRFLPAP